MATLIATNGSSREIPASEAHVIGDLVEHVLFPDGSSMYVLLDPEESDNVAASGLCLLKKKPRPVQGAAVFLSRAETQALEGERAS